MQDRIVLENRSNNQKLLLLSDNRLMLTKNGLIFNNMRQYSEYCLDPYLTLRFDIGNKRKWIVYRAISNEYSICSSIIPLSRDYITYSHSEFINYLKKVNS